MMQIPRVSKQHRMNIQDKYIHVPTIMSHRLSPKITARHIVLRSFRWQLSSTSHAVDRTGMSMNNI